MVALDDFGFLHMINNATKLGKIQVFSAKETWIRRNNFTMELFNFIQSMGGFQNIRRNNFKKKSKRMDKMSSKCTNTEEKEGAKFSSSALSMFSVC